MEAVVDCFMPQIPPILICLTHCNVTLLLLRCKRRMYFLTLVKCVLGCFTKNPTFAG